MLMDYDFDPTIRNKDGNTPVDFLEDGDPRIDVISTKLAAKGIRNTHYSLYPRFCDGQLVVGGNLSVPFDHVRGTCYCG
jgi:hypothetical protein